MATSAKFRAWQNPKYIHYGGFSSMERESEKNDPNPKVRAQAGKYSRMRTGGRTTKHDDRARMAAQMAAHREKYSDPSEGLIQGGTLPPRLVGRGAREPTSPGPEWSTSYNRQDNQQFRARAAKTTGSLALPHRSAKYQRKKNNARRSKTYNPQRRGSTSSMVTVENRTMRSRPGTSGTLDTSSYFKALGASTSHGSLPHPAAYGRQVDFRNRSAMHHLVLKEHRAKVAARQKAMIDDYTVRSKVYGGGSTMEDSMALEEGSWGGASPISRPQTSPDQPPRMFSREPVFHGFKTSDMRYTSKRPKSTPAKVAAMATSTFGMETTVLDDQRVMHAASSTLRSSLRFGQSVLEHVDLAPKNPLQLKGASSGLASMSRTSLFSPGVHQWHQFAAQPLQPQPSNIRFGPLKCGKSYAFPARVVNYGLVPRRLRVLGAQLLLESSPAQISVSYNSVRLAPGMSATVDIILFASQPGKVFAEVEVATEEHSMTVPVEATYLTADAFEATLDKAGAAGAAARAKAASLARRGRGSGEVLLIPNATHKSVMVVPPRKPVDPDDPASGLNLGIVDAMERKLRDAGYKPAPIGLVKGASRPGSAAGEGEGEGEGGAAAGAAAAEEEEDEDDWGVMDDDDAEEAAIAEKLGLHHAGNKRELNQAATKVQSVVRGRQGRDRFERIASTRK